MHVVDGNKVRAIRQRNLMSQMELAVEAGSSPSYISSVETARSGIEMTVDMAMRLTKALSTPKHKIAIEDLLSEV